MEKNFNNKPTKVKNKEFYKINLSSSASTPSISKTIDPTKRLNLKKKTEKLNFFSKSVNFTSSKDFEKVLSSCIKIQRQRTKRPASQHFIETRLGYNTVRRTFSNQFIPGRDGGREEANMIHMKANESLFGVSVLSYTFFIFY